MIFFFCFSSRRIRIPAYWSVAISSFAVSSNTAYFSPKRVRSLPGIISELLYTSISGLPLNKFSLTVPFSLCVLAFGTGTDDLRPYCDCSFFDVTRLQRCVIGVNVQAFYYTLRTYCFRIGRKPSDLTLSNLGPVFYSVSLNSACGAFTRFETSKLCF